MNFLAHAYLSFQHPPVVVGNMISDFIKGKARYDYPPDIQKGITLHRAIDTFTDTHATTKEAMEIFRPHYRLYSGAIMDIVYDHFLASDTAIFPGNSLLPFTQQVYTVLEEHAPHLPPLFAHVFTYMKTENWLWSYRTKEGLERSLKGLVRRAAYMQDSAAAIGLFHQHYTLLQQHYTVFIRDVKNFAKQQLDELLQGK